MAVGPTKWGIGSLTTELLKDGGGDKRCIFQEAEPLVQVGREWALREHASRAAGSEVWDKSLEPQKWP